MDPQAEERSITESLEQSEGVLAMDDIIDLLLVKVLEEAHLRSLRPKKKCKVRPIKPFKEPSKSVEELEKQKIQNEKIDSMLRVIKKRAGLKPNEDRLEIFQNLQMLDTIMEFYQVCWGGVQGVQKSSDELDALKAKEPELKEFWKEGKKKDVKEEEIKAPTEAVTHILDVFKCNKCNHAFEKINLFVKHFIKVHKDVIDANKNSSSFSFSNFWTKMKVRASVKKKDKEDDEKNCEMSKPEEKPTVKEEPKKHVVELSIIDELIALKLFKMKKPPLTSQIKYDATDTDVDLEMDCESQPFSIQRRIYLDERDAGEDDGYSLSVTDFHIKNRNPGDFQSCIFLSEGEMTSYEMISKAELEVTDKYQMIPLSEIKLENPFEDLPFSWKYEDFVPEVSKSGLEDVVDICHEDTVLGLASEAEIVALEVVASILHQMESILSDIFKEDDVEELFQEEFHDELNRNISHQIYIKDFTWIPLEDQFTDCPDHEQEDIAKLFSIKKVRRDEDKITATKMLLLNTDNDRDIIRSYISRIVGERFIPREADHNETVHAKAKYIRFDHNYLPSNKSRKLALLKPPPNVVTTLKRMRSKVDIFPTASLDRKRPCFPGTRPPRKIINSNLLIDCSIARNEVKPKVSNLPMNRGRIQIIPLGKENESPPEYLDKFIRRVNGEPETPEKAAPPPFVDETAPADPELSELVIEEKDIFAPTQDSSASDISVKVSLPVYLGEALLEEDNVTSQGRELTSEVSIQSNENIPRADNHSVKRKRKQESTMIKSSKNKLKAKLLRKRSSEDEICKEDTKKLKLLEESFPSLNGCAFDNSSKENIKIMDESSPTSKGPVIISESSLMDHSASMQDAWKDIDEFLDSSVTGATASNVSDSLYDSQLSDHLDSLREPPEPSIEVDKASGQPEASSSVSTNNVITEPESSGYSIKQEPLEFSLAIENVVTNVPPGPGSYSIKTESSLARQSPPAPAITQAVTQAVTAINIKQEMDTYGLFESMSTNPVKSEPVKSEPLDHVNNSEMNVDDEEEDEIQILECGNPSMEDINRERVDVITNVLRCKECFKSFTSKVDLDGHVKIHSEEETVSEVSFEPEVFNENIWLTVSKSNEIANSKFPSINLQPVSTKNHKYIHPNKPTHRSKIVEAKIAEIVLKPKQETMSQKEKLLSHDRKAEKNVEPVRSIPKQDNVEKQKVPGVVEKKAEGKVEKLTVLQALDSLLQSSKPPQPPQEPKVQPVQSALQALDNLLQSSKPLEPKASQVKTARPCKEPKKKEAGSTLTCQVCWKVTCASMKSMRKHLTFHPHTQCRGKAGLNILF